MSYIDLANRYWQVVDVKGFTASETTLYFRLIDVCNRLGWPAEFTIANIRLGALADLSDKTLASARQRLVDAGLIMCRPGMHHKDAPTYFFPQKVEGKWIFPEKIAEENQEEIQEEIHGKIPAKRGTYNKNKIKNKNNSSSSTREEDEIFSFQQMADDVKANCPIWLDDMAAKLHTDVGRVCQMIDTDFRRHFFADAHAPHQSLRDFQSHFNRWATLQQNQSKHTQRYENQHSRTNRFERRRGTEPQLSQDPKVWGL